MTVCKKRSIISMSVAINESCLTIWNVLFLTSRKILKGNAKMLVCLSVCMSVGKLSHGWVDNRSDISERMCPPVVFFIACNLDKKKRAQFFSPPDDSSFPEEESLSHLRANICMGQQSVPFFHTIEMCVKGKRRWEIVIENWVGQINYQKIRWIP